METFFPCGRNVRTFEGISFARRNSRVCMLVRSFSSLFYRAEYYVRPIDWPLSYRNSESRESTYVPFFFLVRCDQQRPVVRILRDVLMNYSFALCMALIILTLDHNPDRMKCPLNEWQRAD